MLPTPGRDLQDPSTGSSQPATTTTTRLHQELFEGNLSPAPPSVPPTPPTSTTPPPLLSSTSVVASQRTNLLQHQPTMEQAATLRMPTRGHFSAPKWDETKPRELTQYFRELEYLLRDCNITDPMQMKEYTSRYVLYDTAETWTGITEFNMQIPGNQEGAAPRAATYEEWKAAVICLYPGAEESTCYTVNDLHQLAQDIFEDGIYTIGTLSTYYRDFQRIAQWLLQNGKLYHNKECRLFQQGIPTSLWTKIACRLEIAKPDHHLLEPYDVEDVLEAGKWALKVSNGTPGILPLPTTLIASLLTLTAPSNYVKQEDLNKAISTALSSAMTRLELLMNNSITANRQRNNQGSNNNGNNPPNNNLCHFCGELGHGMSRGQCPTVENYLRQGKICRATDGKVVLPSGVVIPNYPDLKTFQERVNKWHRRNPNNIATATLTGNANPDAEQALQQQLIQEILLTAQPTAQPTTVHATLTWQEMINNLEQWLQALKNQTFDGVEICQPKQAPKGYKPMANAAAPATAPPPATTSTAPSAPVPIPAPDTVAPAASTAQSAPAQPPLHPYSGIPNHYAPPAQKNFAALDKRQEGPYQPTVPVYDIEKSNHVFSCIMKSAITLLVEELCSITPDVHN
ncbi:hypothetical protein C0992_003552 [Termitomyces sp. T32_za158]|nr:hypothetical protein C0992_003552 [Termitomyces sp. T32_za158]